MSILSVDTIQPIGSGSTVTLNAAKTAVGTGITFESNGQAIYAGIITATTFVGNLTGNPTGTLQTAAQPNITSVGTLSALTVSGNVNCSAGDISIGTGTPRQKLHIHASDSGASNMVFTNATTGNSAGDGFIVGITGGEDAQLNMQESADLKFSTADTERFRITSDGYLKIGGHSANRDVGGLSAQMVHLEGTSGSASISLINNQNSGGNSALYLGKSRGTSIGSNVILQNGDPMGSIVWCGSDGNDMISQGAVITAEVDGTPGSNDMPGRLVFKTTADGAATTTERLRIASDGRITQIGKSGAATSPAIDPLTSYLMNDGESRLQLCSTNSGSNASAIILSNESKHWVVHQRGPVQSNRFDIAYQDIASPTDMCATATKYFSIDTNGTITTPSQPSFRATKSGGPFNNGTHTVVWDQNQHNTGSNYNTSNGRFTAPVTGVYIFHAYSIYTGNSSNDTWDFQKNGSNFPGGRVHFTNNGVGGAWDNVGNTCIISLSANDYITLRASSQEYHGGDWTAFCGSLLG